MSATSVSQTYKTKKMSSLFNHFTEYEIGLLLTALEAQEKKWNAVAKRPMQGYGTAAEQDKKEKAAAKASEFADLQSKISENTF